MRKFKNKVGWTPRASKFDSGVMDVEDFDTAFIRYIETGCAIMYTGASDSIPRKDGHKSEILFDVVTLDLKKKHIYLTRVGAAEDRFFTY